MPHPSSIPQGWGLPVPLLGAIGGTEHPAGLGRAASPALLPALLVWVLVLFLSQQLISFSRF